MARHRASAIDLLLPFDCIPYEGPEHRWREKVVELCWLETGVDHPELAWPTATCSTPMCLYLKHLAWQSPNKLAYPPGVCVYCGLLADTRDHLLPRTWTGEATRKHVLTVPACQQCNSTIADRYLPSITARRRQAQQHIAHKYAALLKMPEWTSEDIAAMGKTLRSTIERGVFDRDLTRARLAWPEDPDYDLRAMQISGIENPYQLGLIEIPAREAA